MAELQTFRAAFNGFNRSDVTSYIERISLQHRDQTRQLKDELAKLQAENDELRRQLAAAQPAEGGEAPAPAVPEDPEAQELAAYRRAEAAERSTMQRIRKQTEKLEAIMASLNERFAAADGEMERLSAAMQEDADKARAVFAGLDADFAETKTAMEALRAETEA